MGQVNEVKEAPNVIYSVGYLNVKYNENSLDIRSKWCGNGSE